MNAAAARRRVLTAGFGICLAAGANAGSEDFTATPVPIVWTLDNLSSIGGHPVTVVGAPRLVDTPRGRAVEFNGSSDGLFLDTNPLEGLPRFTIDVLFEPAGDGAEEQRFVHFEEAESGNRALIELRRLPDAAWTLDTYLRHDAASLTLIDRSRTHQTGRWHTATLTYDGRIMTHYVDGVREASGEVAFHPLGGGRTSIGVRQNRVSWFKGRVRQIRITPEVVIPLWPEGVPGAKPDAGEERLEDGRVYNVQNPTLVYIPPAPGTGNGTAVIACPGGGYVRLAMSNEASGLAGRLRSLGVATFILKYRLAEHGYPAPLQDVLRAIRTVRSRAQEFAVRPDRIGIFGASAGGHLAALAATLHGSAEGRSGAAVDAVSARPDFVALLYPVISLKGPLAHAGSRRALLGEHPPAELFDLLSVETHVTSETPPVFMVHTTEDKSVAVENSLVFFRALRDAGVPVELHVYEKGAHGFGMQPGLGPTSEWPRRLEEWMRVHRWLQ